jgi:hypothetical protein
MIEVILTGHSAWWLRLLNWLGADMTWSHALLRFGDYIIEAAAGGVVKRPWNPGDWERHARFRMRGGFTELEVIRMTAFADGEVGKRYKYEALPLIFLRILKRISRRTKTEARLMGEGRVCTSFVDSVFDYVYLDLVPGEDSPFVLPDDIAGSEILEMIEVG